jgi:hypothetical protein
MDEAVAALPQVLALNRRLVRQRFEERFSATRMARDYVSVYRKLLRRTSERREEATEVARLDQFGKISTKHHAD